MKKVLPLVVIVLLLCSGTYMLGTVHSNRRNKSIADKANTQSLPLLAKRVFLDEPNDVLINFTALRESMKTYVASNNLKGSVYFEYLPTGIHVRVDDTTEEAAASLMKIPVVMELYRSYELGRVE